MEDDLDIEVYQDEDDTDMDYKTCCTNVCMHCLDLEWKDFF